MKQKDQELKKQELELVNLKEEFKKLQTEGQKEKEELLK